MMRRAFVPRGLVMWIAFCGLLALSPAGPAQEQADLERIFSAENIAPRGRTYEALVPDTLDLAERARLAVNALTESLNPGSGYAIRSTGGRLAGRARRP